MMLVWRGDHPDLCFRRQGLVKNGLSLGDKEVVFAYHSDAELS